jgi:predicted house-cleaning noncanonical NTP pyrophosphatase (MazG superfamily)
MVIYNKLVRDKIPEIIRSQGGEPVTRVLADEEFARCLAEKLNEEVAEFHRDQNIEELADILEVVYALAEVVGGSHGELMSSYEKKHEARGGFSNRVFLIGKEE